MSKFQKMRFVNIVILTVCLLIYAYNVIAAFSKRIITEDDNLRFILIGLVFTLGIVEIGLSIVECLKNRLFSQPQVKIYFTACGPSSALALSVQLAVTLATAMTMNTGYYFPAILLTYLAYTFYDTWSDNTTKKLVGPFEKQYKEEKNLG